MGNCQYYYKYDVKYAYDDHDDKKYCYIDYNPDKWLKSIEQYYSKFNTLEIMKQQNSVSPSYSQLKSVDHVSNINVPHIFYLGIILIEKVIGLYWKNVIFYAINDWVQNGAPHGIHSDGTDNRWKYFLYYWYIYPKKGISTAEVNRQCKIAGGLRKIENPHIPKWILNLIEYLKEKKHFIPSNVEINQIGINYYYNTNNIKSVYSSISPHTEHEKFKHVYSISIYSDSNGETFLSFNLLKGTHNGDIKIPLKDCCGSIMINPSWSMNIATHCVSEYELPIGINQWRIVILFRSILDKHEKYFIDQSAASSNSVKKQKRGRKRKLSEI